MKKNNETLDLKTKSLFILSFLIVFSLLFFIAFATFNLGKNENYEYKEKIVENEIIKVVSEESQIITVAEEATRAVVSIVATAEVPRIQSPSFDPFFGLPGPFRDYFEYEEPRLEDYEHETERIQVGAGTGFIVSKDGYIITNRHVVEDLEARYTVFLNISENQEKGVEAEVLALDPSHDLAVLKIDKTDLPYLEFGDSDNLKLGQTAITIGYALGEFDNTISKGIISGLSRSIYASSGYGRRGQRLYNLIQTDAAINFGNSGGPMLNIEGKVIGVNVAMARAENIGFAVASNEAKRAFTEVKETGEIAEQKIAYLGIRYLNINENIAVSNNLNYDYGALIIRGERVEDLAVVPGSPADKAGLLENDIILEFDGIKITERQPLYEIIRRYEPFDEVDLKVSQKGEEKIITVILGENW